MYNVAVVDNPYLQVPLERINKNHEAMKNNTDPAKNNKAPGCYRLHHIAHLHKNSYRQ